MTQSPCVSSLCLYTVRYLLYYIYGIYLYQVLVIDVVVPIAVLNDHLMR